MVLLPLAATGCGGDSPTDPKPASLSELFGNQLLRSDGSSATLQALNGVPLIGIYFADPGCPACAGFTPTLKETYDQLRDEGRPFEVVLVSPGISTSSLLEYMEESGMTWLALSPQSDKGNDLAQRYNVRWIPTLIVVDSYGNTVALGGREEVTLYGTGAYDAWLAVSAGG
jgi:nucleoredoxin